MLLSSQFALSKKKKGSGSNITVCSKRFLPDNTAAGEIAADRSHESGPVGTFDYPVGATTFEQPVLTEPESEEPYIGSPIHQPPSTPENTDEPLEYAEVAKVPEKTYYLRELDDDFESEDDEYDENEGV